MSTIKGVDTIEQLRQFCHGAQIDGKPLAAPPPAPECSDRLPKPAPPCCPVPGGCYQSLWIAAWHPATLNKIMKGHWSNGGRLKRDDKEIVQATVRQCGLVSYDGPRKVTMHLILRPGQRAPDRDAHWKSTLDALVHAGMLRGDTPRFCTMGAVWYSRAMGEHWGTMLLLEDLP